MFWWDSNGLKNSNDKIVATKNTVEECGTDLPTLHTFLNNILANNGSNSVNSWQVTTTPENTEIQPNPLNEAIPSSDYFKQQVNLFMKTLEQIKKDKTLSAKNLYDFPGNTIESQIKNIRIFQELVLNMDTQNYYWKTKKDRKTTYKGTNVIIKDGSYEAKFIQIMLIAWGYNVDKANYKDITHNIDGAIWMETAKAIVNYKNNIKAVKRSDGEKTSNPKGGENTQQIKGDIVPTFSQEKQKTLDFFKAQLGDLISEIEQSRTDINRRHDRGTSSIKLNWNNLEVSSYGKTSTIDISTTAKDKGVIKVWWYDFPYRLNLQYWDNWNILDNETNKKNVQNMVQLITIVHSIIFDYMVPWKEKVNLWDTLKPFYYGDTGLDLYSKLTCKSPH